MNLIGLKRKSLWVILALITVCLIGWAVYKQARKNENTIDLSHASVIQEIQLLNRLETASFTIEKIVESGQQGDPLRNLFLGDRILLIAHGQVVAGIDLTGIQADEVEVKDTKLTVNLPAPIIFGSSLDNAKTKVYDRTQGILTRGDKDLESEARQAAEMAIRQAACEAGILEEARENAVERVRQLFLFVGFTEVNVNIPSGSCT